MNELAIYDSNSDIAVNRAPQEVLGEAMTAAKALQTVVAGKKKPVMFNGEQYLEFEDWQTVARFYGITARVISTEFVDYGGVQGFIAKADAIRSDGMVVSSAEAMCMSDEPNWKIKPLFQLRSMAQTRACAKALRNCLAWVVVLAGYKATPAEEIQDMATNGKPPIATPQSKSGSGEKPKEPSADCEKVTALVEMVEVSTGKSAKGDWTKYAVCANGEKYSTFSETLGTFAQTLEGQEAILSFKKNGKFFNLEGIEPVMTAADGEPVPTE